MCLYFAFAIFLLPINTPILEERFIKGFDPILEYPKWKKSSDKLNLEKEKII